jgi:hypothetical protein
MLPLGALRQAGGLRIVRELFLLPKHADEPIVALQLPQAFSRTFNVTRSERRLMLALQVSTAFLERA